MTEIPTRWQGQRLANPPPRLRRLAKLGGFEVQPNDPDVLRLRDGLMQADPIADAFVEWAANNAHQRPRVLFERVVEGGLVAVPSPPEPLARWFEPLEHPPEWVDRDALRLGCHTQWRPGNASGTILSAMALMGGYRSAAAVKPLARTGALDRMVVRRIAETSRFVLDVMESETLDRFSAGFKSACRVRLMHATVRRSLRRSPDWDTAAWGVPINQADTAATQLEFSAVFLIGLTMLGFHFTPNERDAVMHLWRYVGHVLGADDALLAHDYRDGLRQTYIHSATNPYADDDSRALALALHELPERVAKNGFERAFARLLMQHRVAVSRYTLGDSAVDDLGLPAAPQWRLLPLLAMGRFGLETTRRLVPGATRWAAKHGLGQQRKIIEELLGDAKVEYVPYAERQGSERLAQA